MDTTNSIIERLQEAPDRPVEPAEPPAEPDILLEITRTNARIEALIDILVVSGLLTEPKYEFAYGNVTDFQDETAETVGEFLASRRANLVRLWRSATVE